MVCSFIEAALVVLKLLMFKTCVIFGMSKVNFPCFSGNERVKQNENNSKAI